MLYIIYIYIYNIIYNIIYRRRESYWQHDLDKFQPNGLNEREVPLF